MGKDLWTENMELERKISRLEKVLGAERSAFRQIRDQWNSCSDFYGNAFEDEMNDLLSVTEKMIEFNSDGADRITILENERAVLSRVIAELRAEVAFLKVAGKSFNPDNPAEVE